MAVPRGPRTTEIIPVRALPSEHLDNTIFADCDRPGTGRSKIGRPFAQERRGILGSIDNSNPSPADMPGRLQRERNR